MMERGKRKYYRSPIIDRASCHPIHRWQFHHRIHRGFDYVLSNDRFSTPRLYTFSTVLARTIIILINIQYSGIKDHRTRLIHDANFICIIDLILTDTSIPIVFVILIQVPWWDAISQLGSHCAGWHSKGESHWHVFRVESTLCQYLDNAWQSQLYSSEFAVSLLLLTGCDSDVWLTLLPPAQDMDPCLLVCHPQFMAARSPSLCILTLMTCLRVLLRCDALWGAYNYEYYGSLLGNWMCLLGDGPPGSLLIFCGCKTDVHRYLLRRQMTFYFRNYYKK